MHPQEIIARRLYEHLEALSDERPFVSYDTANHYEADTVFADRIAFIHKVAHSVMVALEEHDFMIAKTNDVLPIVSARKYGLRDREEDT